MIMDNITSPLSSEKKDEALRVLIQTIINSNRNGTMDYFDMKEAATYILEDFDRILTEEDLKRYYLYLAGKWETFKSLSIISKQQESLDREQKVIDKLSQYIKNL
jgi:Ribonuclease G/E